MSGRFRVKLDLGAQGKVIASVHSFDDARSVAAGRLVVDKPSIRFCVREGDDLWELDPSAFDDVVRDGGVIIVQAKGHPASSATPTTPSSANAVETIRPANHQEKSTKASASPIKIVSPPEPEIVTSDSSSSSSDQNDELFSSSEDDDDESVLDVTATSASVRTLIGPNGPISSKERWNTKEHSLMFEKLTEIFNAEQIFYTRKYTEERTRMFQLLLDQYGDNGSKGNFLRGRTVSALISRVANALRKARNDGEKIKQPFRFFFPDRSDNEPHALPSQFASSSSNSSLSRSSTAVVAIPAPSSSAQPSVTLKKANASSPATSRPRQPPEIRRRVVPTATAASTGNVSSSSTASSNGRVAGPSATVSAPNAPSRLAPSNPTKTPLRSYASPQTKLKSISAAKTSSQLARKSAGNVSPTANPVAAAKTSSTVSTENIPSRSVASKKGPASASAEQGRTAEGLLYSSSINDRHVRPTAATSPTERLSFHSVAAEAPPSKDWPSNGKQNTQSSQSKALPSTANIPARPSNVQTSQTKSTRSQRRKRAASLARSEYSVSADGSGSAQSRVTPPPPSKKQKGSNPPSKEGASQRAKATTPEITTSSRRRKGKDPASVPAVRDQGWQTRSARDDGEFYRSGKDRKDYRREDRTDGRQYHRTAYARDDRVDTHPYDRDEYVRDERTYDFPRSRSDYRHDDRTDEGPRSWSEYGRENRSDQRSFDRDDNYRPYNTYNETQARRAAERPSSRLVDRIDCQRDEWSTRHLNDPRRASNSTSTARDGSVDRHDHRRASDTDNPARDRREDGSNISNDRIIPRVSSTTYVTTSPRGDHVANGRTQDSSESKSKSHTDVIARGQSFQDFLSAADSPAFVGALFGSELENRILSLPASSRPPVPQHVPLFRNQTPLSSSVATTSTVSISDPTKSPSRVESTPTSIPQSLNGKVPKKVSRSSSDRREALDLPKNAESALVQESELLTQAEPTLPNPTQPKLTEPAVSRPLGSATVTKKSESTIPLPPTPSPIGTQHPVSAVNATN